MTKKVLIQARELDAAAERAGGYVADPATIKANPQGERDFSAIRQYSLEHGVPISKMTQTDYTKLGISPR